MVCDIWLHFGRHPWPVVNGRFGGLLGKCRVREASVSVLASFPAIQLTQDTIDSIQNQLNDVGTTLDDETDTALKSIAAYNQLVQTYTAAAKTSYEVYLSRSQSYSLGTETIEDVLQAESDFYTSSGQRVLAQTQLDQARINLHRIMLTDQFDPKSIAGCAQNVTLSGGDWGPFGWINDIFHPSADRVTLDQMCKGPVAAPSPAPSASSVIP